MGDDARNHGSPEQNRKQHSKSSNEEYAKKRRDVRWQQMRLRVFERDGWQCRACFGEGAGISLHAHHTYYKKGADPWDYPLDAIVTLCETCHEREHHKRWQAEQELLKVLRQKGVLIPDLNWFASHCRTDETVETPSTLIFAFGWILGDPHLQKLVIDLVNEKL